MISAQVPSESDLHLISPIICVIGFICGVIALFGIPKYGTKGILVPAIIGLCITGLIIASIVVGIIELRKQASSL